MYGGQYRLQYVYALLTCVLIGSLNMVGIGEHPVNYFNPYFRLSWQRNLPQNADLASCLIVTISSVLPAYENGDLLSNLKIKPLGLYNIESFSLKRCGDLY